MKLVVVVNHAVIMILWLIVVNIVKISIHPATVVVIMIVVLGPIVLFVHAEVLYALHAIRIPLTVIHRVTTFVGGIVLYVPVVMQMIIVHVIMDPMSTRATLADRGGNARVC